MITEKDLIEFGMTKPDNEMEAMLYPLRKEVVKESEEDAGDFVDLCISMEFNSATLVIVTVDSDIILNCQNIEELKVIERCIVGYSSHT